MSDAACVESTLRRRAAPELIVARCPLPAPPCPCCRPTKFGHGTLCSAYVRKNTGSFGWDCAAAFVSQGIWKTVALRITPPASASIDAVVPVVSPSVEFAGGGPISDDRNGFDVEVRGRARLLNER